MTTSYSGPSVAVIQEISEDEREYLRSQGESCANEKVHQVPRASQEIVMPSPKANISKEREKERDRERDRERSRRYHKSVPSGSNHRHSSKNKSKNTSGKRTSILTSGVREHEYEGRSRHRRSYTGRSRSISSSESSSSESEGDEPERATGIVLSSARARLNSPSTISNLTSLTSNTNNSSSSSGSNSTVTQASITKRLSPKRAEFLDAPISPAVPDPPNVFAYLDTTESVVGQDGEEGYERTSNWSHLQNAPVVSALPPHISRGQTSSSSSTSSSHHGDDNASETHHDVDTDRTTPEGSIGDHDEVQQQEDYQEPEPEENASNRDNASTKIASQLAAAQQRQNYHGRVQSFGTPNMQRGSAILPHLPLEALNARSPQLIKQHPLPRAEKLPVSGYELLASRLSSRPVVSDTENRGRIKPIYRKFEALNHRVLLHLQDELSELEEQLHRLELSDTQSRRTESDIVPASRRAAAAAGGELQWHKTDILGKIGFKLAQYNQALSSFNSTRSLTAPQPEDVDAYRSYLDTAHPITEAETRFLDPEDDLVSIYSDHVPFSTTSFTTSRQSSSSSYPPSSSAAESKSEDVDCEDETDDSQSIIRALAAALAVSILIPILTFSVIPGFVGRITATSLVVGGALVALMQGRYITQGMLLKSEGLMCAGIYGGVMFVIAGIVPA